MKSYKDKIKQNMSRILRSKIIDSFWKLFHTRILNHCLILFIILVICYGTRIFILWTTSIWPTHTLKFLLKVLKYKIQNQLLSVYLKCFIKLMNTICNQYLIQKLQKFRMYTKKYCLLLYLRVPCTYNLRISNIFINY